MVIIIMTVIILQRYGLIPNKETKRRKKTKIASDSCYLTSNDHVYFTRIAQRVTDLTGMCDSTETNYF